jgi:nucleoside phosphorylase
MRMSAEEGIVALPSSFTVEGEPDPVTTIACDPALVSRATGTAATLDLPAWPEAHRLHAHRPGGAVAVHVGPVASADVWLQDPAWLDATHHRTGSLCEDMEAAAIGTICALHGIPFLTVKDISNNEFHAVSAFEGTESELPVEEVGKRAAMVIMAVLERIATTGA